MTVPKSGICCLHSLGKFDSHWDLLTSFHFTRDKEHLNMQIHKHSATVTRLVRIYADQHNILVAFWTGSGQPSFQFRAMRTFRRKAFGLLKKAWTMTLKVICGWCMSLYHSWCFCSYKFQHHGWQCLIWKTINRIQRLLKSIIWKVTFWWTSISNRNWNAQIEIKIIAQYTSHKQT